MNSLSDETKYSKSVINNAVGDVNQIFIETAGDAFGHVTTSGENRAFREFPSRGSPSRGGVHASRAKHHRESGNQRQHAGNIHERSRDPLRRIKLNLRKRYQNFFKL